MRFPTSTSRSALSAALLATVLGLAACGDADEPESLVLVGVDVDPSADTSANDGVRLLNAGTTDRLTLPVGYEVGDTATSTVSFDLAIGVDGRADGGGMSFEMTQTVIEVADDGDATVEVVVNDAALTGNIAGNLELERELDEVVGVRLVSAITSGGTLTGEIRRVDGGEVPAFFTEQVAQVETDVEFPTEPVGVGAVWTATTEVESNGITVEAETRFDLIEVTDNHYVVEITQLVPIDERIDGQRVEGLLDADGRLTVDRDNPLDVDMVYEQVTEISADDLALSIELSMTFESE